MTLPFGSRRFISTVVFVSAITRGFAADFTVGSIPELKAKLEAAKPGDTITVKKGAYTFDAPIAIEAAGRAGQPITINAEEIGGVEINGRAGFKFEKPAAYVVLRGFTFKHASGQTTIAPGATHCSITRCIFACAGEGAYLTVSGDDTELDHNEFRNKKTLGNMLSVTGEGSQVARRLWVHHNFFHDFVNAGGNGAETIRFGLSGLSMSTGAGIIEYNLFLRCTGENETISNKSCGNTYRYNSFVDCPGGELSQRHGNDCLIYGNYFKNTQGIRIFGDRHQVFSNYLEGNSIAITIGNGDGEVADGAKLTSHDRPDHCIISFNTLVNNKVNFQMTDRKNGLGATHTTFANNLIVGGGPAAVISKTSPYVAPVWKGNLIWKTAGPGDLPTGSFTEADPKLARDNHGVYHLQKGSPAIDAAEGDFPAVVFDQDGQPRANPKDKGADEYLPDAPATVHPLTSADVGPSAKAD